MSRIFNIYISHNNNSHTGIVTVRDTPFFTEYTLRCSEELMKELPGNKIISTSPDHFIFQHASQQSSPLMQAVIRAVTQHLQTMEA